MKRAARRQLWFLAAVLVLLAAAWWQLRSDRMSAPGTLLTLDPNAITHVDLQISQAPAEHYVKRDGHWWSADQTAAADDLRLGELVRIASAPVQNWQPADSYDPTKIGLSPPQATLNLDGQTLRFGGMTAIGQRGYVQVGSRIGIVSLRYMPRSVQSASIKGL
ncbi:hypothetical protein GCM10007862_33140 [Dyella lipolytica]|uniref:DUF4340 domain-containing protein n=1 Tax=Dyella lipolytica TaxID=1867835 RepID=A0ABW8IZR7_9GAMM|nr:hypothetical protein [Dyella lipolytica]GLQ48263.1 hypothetical protein GCM10007862_33140 [Dyella lipolytica]